MTLSVDVNADLGESFGNYIIGNDEKIIPLISSANVACGFHASDPKVMLETVKLIKNPELDSVHIRGFQIKKDLDVDIWTVQTKKFIIWYCINFLHLTVSREQ